MVLIILSCGFELPSLIIAFSQNKYPQYFIFNMGLLTMNSLFMLFENTIISSSFLKDNVARYTNLSWIIFFFSFSTLNMPPTVSWPLLFLIRSLFFPPSLFWEFFVHDKSFLFCCFHNFHCVFRFHYSYSDVSGSWNFFELILLGIYCASWMFR